VQLPRVQGQEGYLQAVSSHASCRAIGSPCNRVHV
jgi:hypothetical protein